MRRHTLQDLTFAEWKHCYSQRVARRVERERLARREVKQQGKRVAWSHYTGRLLSRATQAWAVRAEGRLAKRARAEEATKSLSPRGRRQREQSKRAGDAAHSPEREHSGSPARERGSPRARSHSRSPRDRQQQQPQQQQDEQQQMDVLAEQLTVEGVARNELEARVAILKNDYDLDSSRRWLLQQRGSGEGGHTVRASSRSPSPRHQRAQSRSPSPQRQRARSRSPSEVWASRDVETYAGTDGADTLQRLNGLLRRAGLHRHQVENLREWRIASSQEYSEGGSPSTTFVALFERLLGIELGKVSRDLDLTHQEELRNMNLLLDALDHIGALQNTHVPVTADRLCRGEPATLMALVTAMETLAVARKRKNSPRKDRSPRDQRISPSNRLRHRTPPARRSVVGKRANPADRQHRSPSMGRSPSWAYGRSSPTGNSRRRRTPSPRSGRQAVSLVPRNIAGPRARGEIADDFDDMRASTADARTAWTRLEAEAEKELMLSTEVVSDMRRVAANTPSPKTLRRGRHSRDDQVVDQVMNELFASIHSKQQAREVFRQIDTDSDGSLSAGELRQALTRLGTQSLSTKEAQMVLTQLDCNGDGKITSEEFIAELFNRKTAKLRAKLQAAVYGSIISKDGQLDYVKLFRKYDRDNSGTIDLKEFKRAVRVDTKVTVAMMDDREVCELFEYLDESGDGRMDLREFVAMFEGEARGVPSSPVVRAVDAVPSRGTSAGDDLCLAARDGDLGRVQAQLKTRTDVNSRSLSKHATQMHGNHIGWTALAIACAGGHTEVAQALLDARADVNLRSSDHGSTALHLAVEGGHEGVVASLLDAGADKAATNSRGKTAQQVSRYSAVTDLLVMGASSTASKLELKAARDAEERQRDEEWKRDLASRTPAPDPWKGRGAQAAVNGRITDGGPAWISPGSHPNRIYSSPMSPSHYPRENHGSQQAPVPPVPISAELTYQHQLTGGLRANADWLPANPGFAIEKRHDISPALHLNITDEHGKQWTGMNYWREFPDNV